MTNEIHNKINALFSEEISLGKYMILSPENKSIRKKKKIKEKSSNILEKVEKSIELNKEEKAKSKKRRSSRIKKKVVDELCRNELKPKVSQEIKNNKRLRATFSLNLKKKQKDKDKEQKKEISEESNESDNTDSNENCENPDEDKKKKKNNVKIRKNQKKSKEKQNSNENSIEQIENKKDKKKKMIRKIFSTCHNHKNNDSMSFTDNENNDNSFNDNDNNIHFNFSNNIKKIKIKNKIRKTDTKNMRKMKHLIINDNTHTTGNLNNKMKKYQKDNTLIYYSSEKNSDNKSLGISLKSTKINKNKDVNSSLIKVKRANNRKKIGDKSSEFQISQGANNLFIKSERENIILNRFKNMTCPGNIISFEYNVSQRRQNDTTRTENNNNNDNCRIKSNEKLNNITDKNELSEINEIEIENNNNNNSESNNNNDLLFNTKSNNNDNNKVKKKKLFCCL